MIMLLIKNRHILNNDLYEVTIIIGNKILEEKWVADKTVNE